MQYEAEKQNQDLELLIQYLREFSYKLIDLENNFNTLNQINEKRLSHLINGYNSHYVNVNYQSRVSSLFSDTNEIKKQLAHTIADVTVLLNDATRARYRNEDES